MHTLTHTMSSASHLPRRAERPSHSKHVSKRSNVFEKKSKGTLRCSKYISSCFPLVHRSSDAHAKYAKYATMPGSTKRPKQQKQPNVDLEDMNRVPRRPTPNVDAYENRPRRERDTTGFPTVEHEIHDLIEDFKDIARWVDRRVHNKK